MTDKKIYVLLKADEDLGEETPIGWHESREHLESVALERSWERYRDDLAYYEARRPDIRIMSPDETDYRPFRVVEVDRIE